MRSGVPVALASPPPWVETPSVSIVASSGTFVAEGVMSNELRVRRFAGTPAGVSESLPCWSYSSDDDDVFFLPPWAAAEVAVERVDEWECAPSFEKAENAEDGVEGDVDGCGSALLVGISTTAGRPWLLAWVIMGAASARWSSCAVVDAICPKAFIDVKLAVLSVRLGLNHCPAGLSRLLPSDEPRRASDADEADWRVLRLSVPSASPTARLAEGGRDVEVERP